MPLPDDSIQQLPPQFRQAKQLPHHGSEEKRAARTKKTGPAIAAGGRSQQKPFSCAWPSTIDARSQRRVALWFGKDEDAISGHPQQQDLDGPDESDDISCSSSMVAEASSIFSDDIPEHHKQSATIRPNYYDPLHQRSHSDIDVNILLGVGGVAVNLDDSDSKHDVIILDSPGEIEAKGQDNVPFQPFPHLYLPQDMTESVRNCRMAIRHHPDGSETTPSLVPDDITTISDVSPAASITNQPPCPCDDNRSTRQIPIRLSTPTPALLDRLWRISVLEKAEKVLQDCLASFAAWQAARDQDTSVDLTISNTIPAAERRRNAEPATNKRRKPNRRDSDSSDDKKNAQSPKKPRKSNDNPRRLACPYYKADPMRYIDCLSQDHSRTTSHIKQHLKRKHCQPKHFCPTCGQKFDRQAARDNHIRERSCQLKEFSFEGMTKDQQDDIKGRSASHLSERARWNSIWDVLFPERQYPLTIYLHDNVACEIMDRLKEWLQFDGEGSMSHIVQRSGLLGPQPEPGLAQAIQSVLLGGMFDRLVQQLNGNASGPRSTIDPTTTRHPAAVSSHAPTLLAVAPIPSPTQSLSSTASVPSHHENDFAASGIHDSVDERTPGPANTQLLQEESAAQTGPSAFDDSELSFTAELAAEPENLFESHFLDILSVNPSYSHLNPDLR